MKSKHFYNLYLWGNKGIYLMVIRIAIAGISLWLSGCDSFSETDMPVSELNASEVFEQKNTATAAMTDIYAQIRDNGLLTGKTTGMSRELGLYADELTWYGSNALPSVHFYNNTLLPSMQGISSWWNSSYTQIYAANAVIEGVQGSKGLLKKDKDQLTGEALLVRGLLHFYLLQLWGAIPYVTTTDYHQNTTVGRMTADMVYAHIIEDLTTAETLLPAEYEAEGRVRPNSFVATALLARVYLYHGQWAEAANSASAVLNNTGVYVWQNTIDGVFLKGSTETIWQLMPRTATRNTDEGATFIFTSGPPPVVALSSGLVSAFESGDLRKSKWTKAISKGTALWYHAYKYKRSATSTPSQEYSVVLRLAEQYLIRAEARAQQGDLIGAKEDLNKIRNRAGLGDTAAVTQTDILAAILRERRIEFFTEYGHRFFDLKRSGQLDGTLSGVKPDWNSTDSFLPIPETELNLNPNIKPQNPGY
jgi:hypothetical protein